MAQKVRTRLAPSPTGRMHIGTVQKMVYCYACAKRFGGEYILRVEDTDRKRFVEGSEDEFYEIHEILGIKLDESPKDPGKFGPYRQSERQEIYLPYVEELIEKGFAYYAFETPEELAEMRSIQQAEKRQPKYEGIYRDFDLTQAKERVKDGEKFVVRIKVPRDQKVTFEDIILGEITFDTNELDDYVLFKSDGFPTYHLANVVDDHLMEISHVFRGVEWISTAPIHILLYQFFDWEAPKFAHIPNILDPNGGKLAKRSGSVATMDFFAQGYLPEAIINFISLLGWSPKSDQEIFSLDELVDKFNFEGFNKSNPVFNRDKLNWFNEQYIRKMSTEELVEVIKKWAKEYHQGEDIDNLIQKFTSKQFTQILELEQERITLFSDLEEKLELFANTPKQFEFDHKQLKKLERSEISQILESYKQIIEDNKEAIKENKWTHDDWEKEVRAIVEKLNRKPGEVFMSIRIAVTGVAQSPPIFEFANVIGFEEHINRLELAINQLN